MSRMMLALLPLLLVACGEHQGPVSGADRPIAIRLGPVTVERVARPVIATGLLGSKEEVPLGFKIGGVIGRVLVDEGRTVRAGDTLALLDLAEIDAAVTRARSAAEKAERDLVRARRLYADSVTSLEQAQNAETGRDVAVAELQAATFDRRYAVILAPASGVVLRRNAEPGEQISAGTPVLTLGSHARGIVMRVPLADRDVVRIRLGDPATVRFDALPGTVFQGRVREIGASADPLTGTFMVEVSVPAAAGSPSGLVGQVEIRPTADRPMATVPVEAILEGDGTRATVFTLSMDGQRAERRTVRVAFLTGDRVVVAAGLENVRNVVTAGAAYLSDGDAVRVTP